MTNINNQNFVPGGLATAATDNNTPSTTAAPTNAAPTAPPPSRPMMPAGYPYMAPAYHIQGPHTMEMDDMMGNGQEMDDSDEGEGGQGGSGSQVTGKTRAGRRKILIQYIEDKGRRHITFSKRKAGIMKKAYELSTLTGTQVLLLVASETGHVYTFATPKLQPLITKPEGKNLIQACLNAPDHLSAPPPDYGPYDHLEETSGEAGTTAMPPTAAADADEPAPVNAQAAAAVAAANYAAALAGMTAAGYGQAGANQAASQSGSNYSNQLSAAAYAAAYNQAVAAGYWPQQAAQQAAAAAAAASGLHLAGHHERPSLSPSPAQLAAAAAAASYYQHHQLQQRENEEIGLEGESGAE